MKNKHILLGISGGIAAYKIPDLVRRLREQETEVRVVMTQGATQFITPLTLQAVSGHAVQTDLLNAEAESAFGHIDLARWADLVLIAPATAHFLAKLAHGLADDVLSTLCLATTAPLAVAPAMNQQMWQAPATQANCQILRERGVHFCGPASGSQACGEVGAGRLLEPLDIVEQVRRLWFAPVLASVRVLMTAGPTREDIDPVRFISNRSSGRMGYAIAQAAQELGATVTLISGPVSLPTPVGVQRVDVYSAADMFKAVQQHIADTTIFIATAAVADYRPAQQTAQKIKKHTAAMHLELEPTQDILAWVGEQENPPFMMGFAAETQNVANYAQNKLRRKNLDMIAANQVGLSGQGFDSGYNALQVFYKTANEAVEQLNLPLTDKLSLARQLLQAVAQRYQQKTGDAHHAN